jgi:hypothetical protein
MHDHHLVESASGLGFWDIIIAHIKFYPTRYATVEDLLGKHKVLVCTGPMCGFGSAMNNSVKRHLHVHKGGRESEIITAVTPEIE